MILSFADRGTEDIFNGVRSKAARRLPQFLWPVIQRKLDMLNAAHILGDLRAPPGNRLEMLRGDQTGRYGIRVNEQYRLTFRFENGGAAEVICEDYH
jgi:proteic killer suppression protein